MSQEQIEIMRRGVEAFARRDKAAWLATLGADPVVIPAPEWPESAPIRGAEAIWDFYVEVTAAWDERPFELREVIEVREDTLVANWIREARGKASGASTTFSYWTLMTFRDGKTVRTEWFSDRAAALDAAGLAP